VKASRVQFYFDADVLGLAHVICGLRHDCTYPGDPGAVIQGRERPPCLVDDPSTKDPDWLPVVTERGWLIITRDRHIARRPSELHAVRSYGARLVAISGAEGTSKWNQLEIVMRQWRALEQLTAEPGPFVVTATRSRLTRIL